MKYWTIAITFLIPLLPSVTLGNDSIDYYNQMLLKTSTTPSGAASVASEVNQISGAIDSATSRSIQAKDSSDCDTTILARSTSRHRPECNFDGVTEEWKDNCEKLYSSQIPKGALDFTLGVMAKNSTSFRSNKCFDKKGLASSGHYSMGGTKSGDVRARMANGLKNKCTFVINDMGDKKAQCRGTMYFIDMCKGAAPKITETYVNMGSGTCRLNRGFLNESGKQTTTLGAFITNDHVFNFSSTKSSYVELRRSIQRASGEKKAHALQVFGLQNTNNSASKDMKYMHVSPYQSSWGCPSIAGENYWMIKELAKNHPSLLVNYHEGKMEDINKCSE